MGVGLIQPMHLLLILVIVLVVFGAGKLSQVGGALGKSVKEFKESVNEGAEEQPAAVAPPTPPKAEKGAARAPRPAEALLQREEI
jgi:sec-independent protein translocase protein TatA